MAFNDDRTVSSGRRPSPVMLFHDGLPRSPPIRPSLAPGLNQPLSFSISRILGLEDSGLQPGPSSSASNNVITETNGSHRYESRQSSDQSPGLDSDNPSTDVDSGRESEAGRVTPSSERPRKKKQRTTFSPIEVWELERVFVQRPYLMPEDEDDLVQKLGLTIRNIRFWFQNRRAKLRRQDRKAADVQQTSPSNQFDWISTPPLAYNKHQFGRPEFPFSHPQRPYTPVRPVFSSRNVPYTSPPITAPCPCRPVRSNRFQAPGPQVPPCLDYLPFKSDQFKEASFQSMRMFPRFHPDQFREKEEEELAGARHGPSFHNYQPRGGLGTERRAMENSM